MLLAEYVTATGHDAVMPGLRRVWNITSGAMFGIENPV